MKFTDRIERIKLDKIVIRRDERQRREVSTDGLLESIKARGVYNPIIVRRLEGDQVELVAGERRLTASTQLGLKDIPCRFVEDLSPLEAKIVELEENIKRQDLAWQDELFAIKELHELYTTLDPTWTQVQTADSLGFTAGMISRIMRVAKNYTDPRIAAAPTMIAAYNMLARLDSRKAGDAMSEIMEAGISIFSPSPEPASSTPISISNATPTPTEQPAPEPKPKSNGVEEAILNENFLEWAPQYSGPRFNFIHCDFPYGINVFAGKLSGREKWLTYGDEPDDYFALIECLCSNLDRLMSHSGHLMFWFSMENYEETLRAFRELAPSLTFQKFPLFWMKSDNVGIIPDAKRQPRRIYETALIASREDRFILRSVSNAYAAPTDKAHHHSTKPEPVLRHFFQMFVDETSKVLDPTCGSASALRAAESLGAQKTLGLEVDPEHCANARSALRHFRALRAMSKGASA